MVAGCVHYEVFGRRKQGSGWILEMATEDRSAAVLLAEDLIAERRCVSVKVTKETLDEESREFASVCILSLGAAETKKKEEPRRFEPLCVQPQDLYTLHARERIGRLLGSWLERHHATPFELLHRPDLAEALEASEGVLLQAIQKISVPEATERRVSVHELIRDFQALVDRGGAAAPVGRWGLAEIERLIVLWHRFRAGDCDRPALQRRLIPLQARLGRLLRRGQ